jgi:hypothetical protein
MCEGGAKARVTVGGLAHKVAKGRRQHRFGCLRGASCLCLVCMHACPVAHSPHVSIRTKRRVFNERASASDEARIQLGTFFFWPRLFNKQSCLVTYSA